MFKITKTAPNRLDIDLSGSLDADAMRKGLDRLVKSAEGITNGRMLYRIRDFEMPTMGALAIEFQQMPRLFGLIGRFDKCAVLSDTAWLRTAAELEGAVIPNLEIKSFMLADVAAAEEWLRSSPGTVDLEEEENFPV